MPEKLRILVGAGNFVFRSFCSCWSRIVFMDVIFVLALLIWLSEGLVDCSADFLLANNVDKI